MSYKVFTRNFWKCGGVVKIKYIIIFISVVTVLFLLFKASKRNLEIGRIESQARQIYKLMNPTLLILNEVDTIKCFWYREEWFSNDLEVMLLDSTMLELKDVKSYRGVR